MNESGQSEASLDALFSFPETGAAPVKALSPFPPEAYDR